MYFFVLLYVFFCVLCIFVFYVFFCVFICIFCVLCIFVFYVFLCSMYFLCCSMHFCVVLCIVCFVSFSVLFGCMCVLYDCHRVANQLQLNISHHISYHMPRPSPVTDGLTAAYVKHCLLAYLSLCIYPKP